MKISHKLDKEGREIEARLEPSAGLVSCVPAFHISLTARQCQC